jgi:hypothetical protein
MVLGYVHNERKVITSRRMAPVDSDSSSDDLEPKVPGPPKTNIV